MRPSGKCESATIDLIAATCLLMGVRRAKAALSSGCKSHPAIATAGSNRNSHGGTKWLKPSISVSRIGDGASVQAATRVNAEQSSKRTMRGSTRLSGKTDTSGGNERSDRFRRCSGVVAAACTQGKRTKHGKPQGVVSASNAIKSLNHDPVPEVHGVKQFVFEGINGFKRESAAEALRRTRNFRETDDD